MGTSSRLTRSTPLMRDAATAEHPGLSADHSATLGCRMLDIIHVAAALVLGAKEFVTSDTRQGALAKQAGLTVK